MEAILLDNIITGTNSATWQGEHSPHPSLPVPGRCETVYKCSVFNLSPKKIRSKLTCLPQRWTSPSYVKVKIEHYGPVPDI